MPCRSHEDDPSLNAGHGHRAARLLVWFCDLLCRDAPVWAYGAARDHGNRDDRPTQALCALLSDLGAERVEEILAAEVDGRARELERWWQAHEQADAKRDA